MTKLKITADVGIGTYDDDFDCTLAAFKCRLDEAAASIGADETTARFWFETESDYDCGYTVKAYVYRWETDEEYAAREEREARDYEAYVEAQRVSALHREREEYARLKAKYG